MYRPRTTDELNELVKNENIYLGDIDTCLITDMSLLFDNVKRDNYEGIEKWDTSNVKDFAHMFSQSNFNHDISKWNVSNGEDFNFMFFNTPFNKDLSSWNMKNAKYIHSMFANSNYSYKLPTIIIKNINKRIFDFASLTKGTPIEKDSFELIHIK